ncbi:MAG: type II toxin-antitoxin system VapB family antitoxin [Kiritimatiellae bacterium]|nr:type II toxin-antitoxin system VapB family antitoxin [Kiritimatiellia bacterium]MDD4735254.1 type II toxin-antitoxin system VapB family antitoxin [Kiritimatiellia bacterium]
MATNLQLDDRLIARAVKLGGHKTKREAVMSALTDYIHHKEQDKIVHLFGTIDYFSDYDYKKQRAKA